MTCTQDIAKEALLAENLELKNSIQFLQEQVKHLQRLLFGKRSEKHVEPNPNILYLPGLEPTLVEEKKEVQTVPAHERKKPVRNKTTALIIPDDLPKETTVIDIPEEEKVCQETGMPLVKIGEEVTRKPAYRPGSYFVKEIIRLKYASAKAPDAGVKIALLPDSLLDRCQADESLLAEILVRKFCDHLHLYRQVEGFDRDNIQISRQILSKWVLRCGEALKPLVEVMTKCILESDNIFIDESPVNMLAPGKGKTQKGFMWVLVGGNSSDPPYRIYDFYQNRRHSNAEKLIKDYKGRLHSEKLLLKSGMQFR